MGGQRNFVSELERGWRRSLLMGIAASVLSLMLGLLFHTAVYEIGKGIPSVIRQDAHVSLPLCKAFPDLYGCEPWVGALTGAKLWEFAQSAGRVSGLLLNLLLAALSATWVTVRVRSQGVLPGLLTGIASLFSGLQLALALHIPLNVTSLWGVFGILALSLLPLSGVLGGRIGVGRLASLPSRKTAYFLPADEAAQPAWTGESLSQRELEVLALVAEGCKNREIAHRLFISEATVKTHLLHIFGKLGVESRTAAVMQALAYGLLCQEEREIEPREL